VFESRMLRRRFGCRSKKVTEGWITLHNEELHDLYYSPVVTRMMKSRKMRWAGQGALLGEKKYTHKFLVGEP
jgi:hypothetical protein